MITLFAAEDRHAPLRVARTVQAPKPDYIRINRYLGDLGTPNSP